MRGGLRGGRIWVVVLVAVTAAVSAGLLEQTSGHVLPYQRSTLGGSTASQSVRFVTDFSQDFAGELTSPDAQTNGEFGYSTALSGSSLVVGAPYESTGHVYVFNAKTGALVTTLASANPVVGGEFGDSVAISGSTIVVGAPYENSAYTGAGHAYIFNAKTGARIATLTSPNPVSFGGFGWSVGVSGSTVIVGAPFESASGFGDAGHAYTFNAKTGALIATLISPNAQTGGAFGWSAAVGGTTIVIGAFDETVSGAINAGHAYLFDAKTDALITTLSSPNSQQNGEFGYASAIGGSTVAVGAPGEGSGHAYTFSGKTGALISSLSSPNPVTLGAFGNSVSVSGLTVAVGAEEETDAGDSYAGHAYTFDDKTGALIATFLCPNPQGSEDFGGSVAVSGLTVAIGAPFESAFGYTHGGQVYLM